jgi:predicted membrane channel-forming protein YqfA (hemolysin III family)
VSDPEKSEDQQLARNLNELLQELRVAQAGVQILFGFLLSITFTERYAAASGYIKATHLITVIFATGAVALLTAPAAWHRLLFRLGRREEIIEVANRLALAGLGCLAAAMTTTVLLLFEMVVGGPLAIVLAVLAAIGFGTLWFALPLHRRSQGPAAERTDEPRERVN